LKTNPKSRNNKSLVYAALFLLISPVLLAVDKPPENPLEQADKFYSMEKYKEALGIYEKIIATYPGTDWASMAYLMSARAYEKMGKMDDADAEYKVIINKHAKSGIAEEAYFAIARIRSGKGKSAEALRAYDSYLKNYPAGEFRVMALFDVACIYKEKGNSSAALDKFGEILKNYPNEAWFYSWAAIYTGHIYYMKKDYDTAIESYQRVLNTKDNQMLYTLSCLHRGQACIEKRDYKTAENIFQNIIKTTQYFTEEALYGLARAEYDSSEFDLAKETLTSLVQLFPDTVWKADAERKLARIQKKLKEDAKNELKAAQKAQE
jgi:tetratricopeptide (TPR) repeat protein